MRDGHWPARHTEPRRRDWLAMAASALAAAGCAGRPPRTASAGRVLVLGGGFAGATAAHYLKRWGGDAVDVTLVERESRFVSCPMSNLVIGGLRRLADITHDYQGLQRMGVRVLQAQAVAVDVASRRVALADGGTLPYDRVVVAPGIDFMTQEIGGLDQALARGSAVHAWKAGPQTEVLRAQIDAMPDGGVVVIAIPRAPYRCPPGPYERACLIASHLKATKPRSKVLVFDANPEITSKKALFERAFAEHHAGVLEYRPDSELREVNGRIARFDFEDVKANVLNVIPPQRAGALAQAAGLVTINNRWAGVEWLTMESTAAPGVHVLGDSVFPGPLMPKSAHMANQQAKLAAAAVLQLLRGDPVNPAPMLMNACYSFVTPNTAIHVTTVHRYDAAERNFKTVPGSGGVSVAASEAEGRHALDWAANIWADSLAL